MTKQELIEKLKNIKGYDIEVNHVEADELLLDFINDKDINEAYGDIEKWYA